MDIKLPRLAEGVESGTVVNILVKAGQQIKKDQPIMELETQKAVGSIPSPESGTVTKIHVKEGMEVAVGQALISIDSGGDVGADQSAQSSPVAPQKASSERAQPGRRRQRGRARPKINPPPTATKRKAARHRQPPRRFERSPGNWALT